MTGMTAVFSKEALMTHLSRQLLAARALIAQRDTWSIAYRATDARGAEVDPQSAQACCFCSLGALQRARADAQAYLLLAQAARESANYDPEDSDLMVLEEFNDTNNHATVLQIWDRAIELAHESERGSQSTSH